MERNKYLAKNTFLLFLGTFGTKFISFFMVPIYTSALSQEQYGTIDIAFTISMMLTPIIALNIHEAIMRFAMDKDADQQQVITAGFVVLFIGMLLFSSSIPIIRGIDGIKDYAALIYCMVWSSALLYNVQAVLKGTDQVHLYALCGVVITFLTASLNTIFLVLFKMGITGYLLSTILAYVISAVGFAIWGKVHRYINLRTFSIVELRKMLTYSIALVPNSILWWIINSSNRLIISGSLGVAANGIFAVSNKLPTLMNNLTTVFQQAWQLTAIKSDDLVDKDEYASNVFSVYTGFLMCCGAGMIWLIKTVMKYYVEQSYFIAWKYTPLLVVAFILLALGSYVGTYYSVSKNSKGMLFSAIAGMLVNIVANFLLIPQIGLQGASIAACLSYATILIYRTIDTRRYIRLRVFSGRFLISISILLVETIILLVEAPFDLILNLLCVCAMFLLYRDYLSMICRTVLRKVFRR